MSIQLPVYNSLDLLVCPLTLGDMIKILKGNVIASTIIRDKMQTLKKNEYLLYKSQFVNIFVVKKDQNMFRLIYGHSGRYIEIQHYFLSLQEYTCEAPR